MRSKEEQRRSKGDLRIFLRGARFLRLAEVFLARLAVGAAVSEVLEASASEVPGHERFREAAGAG